MLNSFSYTLHSLFLFAGWTGFNDYSTLNQQDYNLNWMKSIPDETPVSAISIPGTHESLSLYGGPLAVCQVWDLDKQLNVGIRYFDVHAGIWLSVQNHIYIRDSHWMFWQHIQFDKVLKIIFNFLGRNKSETVLLKIKIHGFFEKKVLQMIDELIKKFKNKIWTNLSVPNMKQARGKIVLLQSNSFHQGTVNIKSFFIKYDKLINVEEKIKEYKSHLCNHHVVLTDTAASFHQSPKTLAKTVNKKLNNFVVEHKKKSVNQEEPQTTTELQTKQDIEKTTEPDSTPEPGPPTSGQDSEPT
uniref:Phosphatidylinositol-specific phospholipase C X domain-containing protein n=1 Tax=Dicentrarchus labrax TaxID=13489 RepID=A0A8P4GDA2_DICLA